MSVKTNFMVTGSSSPCASARWRRRPGRSPQ